MPERGWAIITGEYPPARGGVADYTQQVSQALTAAGDAVRVFAPERFDRRALRQLSCDLASGNWQLLIQYVPHAFGRRAMNLGFAAWVARQAHLRPWVMFHEVAVDWEPGDRWRRHLFAAVTRRMARRLANASARNLVAIPAWANKLRGLAPAAVAAEWLPVPSNLPLEADGRRDQGQGQAVGSFGAVDQYCLRHLPEVIANVLNARPGCSWRLIGAAGEPVQAEVLRSNPELAPRLRVTGYLAAQETAELLAGLDLQVQIYGDGVSSRRGSTMAALGLGKCVLTHLGHNSEDLWQLSGAVALTPVEQMSQAVLSLLDDPARRTEIGVTARRLYDQRFALRHTVALLRQTGEVR